MDQTTIVRLFDYMYSVNGRLLDTAEQLTPAELTAAGPTTRDLRATLVHELDVEWSWRLALQGRPIDELGPEVELRPEDYPHVGAIREHWARDEVEMRAWLDTLTDGQLIEPVSPALDSGSRPLWQYLVHIFTHAMQQQADAATLLSAVGHSPGELGFLEYLAAAELPPSERAAG